MPSSWPALVLALALCGACAAQRGTIGAVLAQTPDGRVLIREVPEGLAADRAGLRAGDEILLVDGRDVRPFTDQQLHELLGGDVDGTVKLTVVRGEQVLRVTLKRTPSRKHRVKG
jgi:C-terminal processing protease CtpA/Prc